MPRLIAFVLLVAGLIGCSSPPPPKPAAVDVKGMVTKAGKPVSNVTINFFPTSATQNQVGQALKADGKFDLKLNPGKYRFAFEGKGIDAIPAKYRTVQAENEVDVPPEGSSNLTITLE